MEIVSLNSRNYLGLKTIITKSGQRETEVCPFCLRKHFHGKPLGHRVGHCAEDNRSYKRRFRQLLKSNYTLNWQRTISTVGEKREFVWGINKSVILDGIEVFKCDGYVVT